MNKLRFTCLNAAAVVVFTLMVTSMAQAQATRTWVSGVGDDANPCSRTAPCKTFAGAISKTATEGEINVIDPGGFGTLTVTKSITVDGNSTHAGISNAGNISGINVNVTSGTDVRKTVRLRNIAIDGMGTGLHGVNFIAGSKLFIENLQIYGLHSASVGTSRGIRVAVATANSQLFVKNTEIGNSDSGIEMSTSSGNVLFSLDGVRMGGMADGVILGAGANGSISNCTIALHSAVGVKITSGTANVLLSNTLISQNGTGVQPITGSTTVFTGVTLFGNGVGIATTGGTLTSHGNNSFSLNGAGAAVNDVGQQ